MRSARAAQAGGDSRGLLSAALLVVGADRPPLSLRVDYSEAPLDALVDLHRRATSGTLRAMDQACPDAGRSPARNAIPGVTIPQ